jgi:hypothetical protein
MTNEENFDPMKSMQIINATIHRAQNRLSENGFLFIFWGWLVFAAALTFWILVKQNVGEAWCVWMIMPLGGIFSIIYGMRQKKREKVRSYIDEYMAYIGISFGISLTIVLTLGGKYQLMCYPTVMLLYASFTFVTGGIIKFKPLIIGGALSFPLCVISMFFPFIDQVLFLALSVLASYIIPGHLLMSQYKKQNPADV